METITQAPSTSRSVVLAQGSLTPEQVQPCDLRTVGGIDKIRLAPLTTASEAFAPALAAVLQNRLGLTCEIAMRPSEQVPSRTFIEKVGNSYLVSLQLGQDGNALLQIDSMLLFPIVDRLLGGSGGPSELSRDFTEIEEHVAKEFVQLICHEMQAAWRAFDVPVAMGVRQSPAQVQQLFATTGNALVFSFSVNMESSGGDFQLMLPVAALGAFLGANNLAAGASSTKGTINARLADKLLGATFGLELALLGGKVAATDLLNLKVGKILQLGVPVRTPAVLKIDGRDSFQALPVRSGQHRGAQLLDRMPQGQPETETTTYE
jgi:flagellar motor switch protein FliM